MSNTLYDKLFEDAPTVAPYGPEAFAWLGSKPTNFGTERGGALRDKTVPVDLLLADLLIVQECEDPETSLSACQQGQATISGKASIKIKVLEYLPAPVLNRLLSLAVFRFTLGPSPIVG